MPLKLHDTPSSHFHDVPIREGDVFLWPAQMRHSLQRPQEGSIRQVIEPGCPEGALDAVAWYGFNCQTSVDQAEVDLVSVVDDLPPIYARFYADAALRICPNCVTLHSGKEPPAGWTRLCQT